MNSSVPVLDAAHELNAALEHRPPIEKEKAMTTIDEIERLAAAVAEARDRLVAAIAGSPELFAHQRSVLVRGIRAGLQLRRGALSWDDDAMLAARIRARLPEQFGELVEVSEIPSKDALAKLDPVTLQDLGVRVKAGGERVFVKLPGERNDNQMALPFDQQELTYG